MTERLRSRLLVPSILARPWLINAAAKMFGALRQATSRVARQQLRNMSSGFSKAEEIKEANKWRVSEVPSVGAVSRAPDAVAPVARAVTPDPLSRARRL